RLGDLILERRIGGSTEAADGPEKSKRQDGRGEVARVAPAELEPHVDVADREHGAEHGARGERADGQLGDRRTGEDRMRRHGAWLTISHSSGARRRRVNTPMSPAWRGGALKPTRFWTIKRSGCTTSATLPVQAAVPAAPRRAAPRPRPASSERWCGRPSSCASPSPSAT